MRSTGRHGGAGAVPRGASFRTLLQYERADAGLERDAIQWASASGEFAVVRSVNIAGGHPAGESELGAEGEQEEG